jgi:FMN phosphatase YigB (HAD superfamily)
MQIQALFFDLDGTLYPNGAGVWNAISERMNGFRNIMKSTRLNI